MRHDPSHKILRGIRYHSLISHGISLEFESSDQSSPRPVQSSPRDGTFGTSSVQFLGAGARGIGPPCVGATRRVRRNGTSQGFHRQNPLLWKIGLTVHKQVMVVEWM